jgi:hypothetical protein
MRATERCLIVIVVACAGGCTAPDTRSLAAVAPGLCGLYGASPPWVLMSSPPSNADEFVALAERVEVTAGRGLQAYWFENDEGRIALCYRQPRSREACGATNVTFEKEGDRWRVADPLGIVVC